MVGDCSMMKRMQHAVLVASLGIMGVTALVWASLMAWTDPALAGMGQPSPRQIGLQEPATDIAEQIHALYNLVNIIIIAIVVFVLALMIWVVVRFNEKSNPVPSKTTHHAGLEFAWTVIPILILVFMALPSFKLLFAQYTYPPADLTIKATGNQWNWTHAYPDNLRPDGKPISFTTTMLNETEIANETKRRGLQVGAPRQLAVDNEVVVPVNKNVHVLITASDVIHNWTIPSFGSKVDAVPGRTTATWFRAKREGIFYGQCSELCGKDHSSMPIAVRVVSQAQFDEWIAVRKTGDRAKVRELMDKIAIAQAKVAMAPATTQVVSAPAR